MWLGVAHRGRRSASASASALAGRRARTCPSASRSGSRPSSRWSRSAMVTWMIVWMRRHARGLQRRRSRPRVAARSREGSAIGLVGDGVLRRAPRGLRDRGVPARRVPRPTDPLAAGTARCSASSSRSCSATASTAAACGSTWRGSSASPASCSCSSPPACSRSRCTPRTRPAGQHPAGQAVDLTWLVDPGTVHSALLTGMFGIQPRPRGARSLAYLVYAIPMTHLRPLAAAAPRPRADARRNRVPPGVRHDRAHPLPGRRPPSRRSLALGRLRRRPTTQQVGDGGRSDRRSRSPTTAASPRELSSSRRARPPSRSPTTARTTVSEFEILDGDRILGEVENIAPGLSGSSRSTLKPGRYTHLLPRRHDAPSRHARRHRARPPARAPAAAGRGRAVPRTTSRRQTALLVDHDHGVHRRAWRPATSEGAKAALRGGPRPLRAHRAGGRELRRPRPGDRRPRGRRARRRSGRASTRSSRSSGSTARPTAGRRSADSSIDDVGDLAAAGADVELEPAQIANGAVELLNEVSKSKITGEEERYSHTDLVDFEANVEGAQGRVRSRSRPGRARSGPTLATEIDERFADVDAALAAVPDGHDGFVAYTTLTKADTRRSAQAIDALAEPLSKVASRSSRGVSPTAHAASGCSAAGAVGAGARARGALGVERLGGRRRRRRDARRRAVPFHGAHQAGIATPVQDRLLFASFDVITDDRDRPARPAARVDRRRPRG